MNSLSNNSILMLEKSMGYLWTKQAAILDNISNAETPNYKAKVVTFEENLRTQLTQVQKNRTPRHAVREVLENVGVSVSEPQGAARMDDNGINVTEQNIELVRNAYQLQYVMQSISSDLSVLRTAVRGQ